MTIKHCSILYLLFAFHFGWCLNSMQSKSTARLQLQSNETFYQPRHSYHQLKRFVIITKGRSGSSWLQSSLDSSDKIICHSELLRPPPDDSQKPKAKQWQRMKATLDSVFFGASARQAIDQGVEAIG
jgi:hypothetical protein